jgi:hypothetical protein
MIVESTIIGPAVLLAIYHARDRILASATIQFSRNNSC